MEVLRWTGLEGDWGLGAETEDTLGLGGVQAGWGFKLTALWDPDRPAHH